MKRIMTCALVCCLAGLLAPCESQTEAASADEAFLAEVREKLLLSLSSEDYPVTPGDTYRISFLTADRLVSLESIVESDFNVNLGFYGKIPARGMAFAELKRQIEQRVLQAYPKASPSITIIANGVFLVRMGGEVRETSVAVAWGLSRLSQVVRDHLTPYSSMREITIVSSSGVERRYDLFLALRFGQKDQDPYVVPGDSVIVAKRQRSIVLTGQVRRPGTYQLLAHEGLKELIEYYGDGFAVPADRSRIRVERLVTESKAIAESFIVDLSADPMPQVDLRDMDTVLIPAKTQRLPVVFLEGAILPEPDAPVQAAIAKEEANREPLELGYSKISVQFKEGATLYPILWERKDRIYPNADLTRSYLVRKDPAEVLPVDLERLLFANSNQDNIALREYDQLIIPFRRFSIAVTGAVGRPGVYPYIPNKDFQYYLDLAGGVDPERGCARSVRVYDRTGLKLPASSFLDPEGRVHVPYSFSFYLLKYGPIVATAVGALLTGLYYFDQNN